MNVIDDDRTGLPIKVWTDSMESGALEQAINLSNLPFAFRHIALMPDVHQGYGMPIGGVLAAKDVIVPNAVGVDIGCGMCAVRTGLRDIKVEQLKPIMRSILDKVPVGFKHQKRAQRWEGFNDAPDIPVIQNELQAAAEQLGTLGGGNHFIEIQRGSDGFIWIMLHSGSRNFGLKIAQFYHKKAVELCRRSFPDFPYKDLSFIPAAADEAKEYFAAMEFALLFAAENRHRMLQRIKDAFKAHLGNAGFEPPINIHHNYAAWETHFGEDVIVHRKGATSAKEGELGIIPGSQGTNSYIVRGKGNPESFCSCSHGAGRRMGRKQAQRELDLTDEKRRLDEQGILHSIRSVKDLDEAAGAYKDIGRVMADQADLVDIVTELTPLAVIKG